MVPLHVPLWQVAPAQQGCPLNPHKTHCAGEVVVEHTLLPSVHALPAQQGSLVEPHVWQVLVVASQISPNVEVDAGQVLPGQQASPSSPQLEHVPVASQKSGNEVLD
jgi:hypothetical protein